MDAQALAHKVRELRKKKELTLQGVADRIVSAGYAAKLSSEMIRRAENPAIETGSRIFELRIAIIEVLENRKISGPMWVYLDEIDRSAPAAGL